MGTPVSRRQRVFSKQSPRAVTQAQESTLTPIMAPIGGINSFDSIITMPVNDAIAATNVIMRTNGVMLRPGWQEYCKAVTDGLTTDVKTIMPYMASTTSVDHKLFAAVGSKIYDVTASSSTPSVALSPAGAASGVWCQTMHSNTADRSFLVIANNGAGCYSYDAIGGWIHRTFTGGPSNINNITSVASSKTRLWFTFQGSTSVWYLDIGNMAGPLHEFPLGSLLTKGGHVAAVTNWTRDQGQTVDDFFVAIGSQGNLIVYSGIDPSSSTTWDLVGNWDVGVPPAGTEYFRKRGVDVMMVTARGVLPLSQVISGAFDPESPSTSFSMKINNQLIPAVNGQITQDGWQVQILPKIDTMLVTQPVQSDGTNVQWACSLTTSAWSQFSGVQMSSSAVFDRQFFFGTSDGRVCTGFESGFDTDAQLIDGTPGSAIVADIQPAFNAYGSPGTLKTFQGARMIFIGPDAPSVSIRMNTQFNTQATAGSPAFVPQAGARWDAGIWDVAKWVSVNNTFETWIGLTGVGYYGSLRVGMSGLPLTAWSASHVLYETGSAGALM